MINDVIIIHLHELALKGKNRSWFEKILLSNLKTHLTDLPYKKISNIAGRIIISDIDINQYNDYKTSLKCLIGIRNFIFARHCDLDIDNIKKEAVQLCKEITSPVTFRVSSRRQNKNFQYNSNEIDIIVGESICQDLKWTVDLKNYDINVIIEIINNDSYVSIKKIEAYGGLPVGTGETGLSLISSGIDSPVASFNIMKRGVKLDYIHFHSSPVTSKQSIYNVEEILKVLCQYQMNCKLYLFPLLDIQNIIMDTVSSKYWVVLFRRAMVKIASIIAFENGQKVLISGESIGQVASQTLSNIVAIQDAIKMPIIRPLSGMNKEEIVNQAEAIGTYNISIEPYEDCCSYFVPPNPETKSKLDRINRIEEKIKIDNIISKHIDRIETKDIIFYE